MIIEILKSILFSFEILTIGTIVLIVLNIYIQKKRSIKYFNEEYDTAKGTGICIYKTKDNEIKVKKQDSYNIIF